MGVIQQLRQEKIRAKAMAMSDERLNEKLSELSIKYQVSDEDWMFIAAAYGVLSLRMAQEQMKKHGYKVVSHA